MRHQGALKPAVRRKTVERKTEDGKKKEEKEKMIKMIVTKPSV